jgi:hypothetical protein
VGAIGHACQPEMGCSRHTRLADVRDRDCGRRPGRQKLESREGVATYELMLREQGR